MSKLQAQDEVGKIIASLLVSKKDSSTIQDLERDFRETEGRALPWCELGFVSSFDLLQNLPKYVKIIQRTGQCIVTPVVTENMRHVNTMVALQKNSKPKKNSNTRRRPASRYFPRMRTEPRLFIPNDLQTQITQQLLQNPQGLSKHCVLQLFRQSYRSVGNVTIDNIDQYLHAMTSTVSVCGNMVYPHRDLQRTYSSSPHNTAQPVTNPNSAIDTAGPTSLLQQTWAEIHKNDEKPMDFSNISFCPAGSEEGGNLDGDIEFDDEDAFDYVSPIDYMTQNRNYFPESAPVPSESREESSIPQLDEDDTSELTKPLIDPRTDENDNLQEEKYLESSDEYSDEQEIDLMNETYLSDDDTSHIINPRTKDRLQKLIQKHPEGIWCAELLNKFFDEYKVNLDFMELGFPSVCELASMLKDVFHCIRLDNLGDFILYDATKPVPEPSTSHRRTQAMSEWVHPLIDDSDEDMYAIPMNLPLYTSQKLIPNNVLAQRESVGQERIPNEACLEVEVAEVYTPTMFWIQFRKRKSKLRNLMANMQAFYQNEGDNYVIPSVVLEKGLNCACTYDNEWHRAIIKTVKPDGNVNVIFYDYGTIQTKAPEALRFLHRSFSNLPAQAIATCLYNIRPVKGDRWTKSASVAFLRKVSNIPLVAMTVDVCHETNSMQVSLTDTRGEEDLHINDWMVEKKYARYGSMVRTRPRNFVLRHYLECEMNKCQEEAERLKLKNSTIKLHLESLDASCSSSDKRPKSNKKTAADLKQFMIKHSKYERNRKNIVGESSTSENAETGKSLTRIETNMNDANSNCIENESAVQSAVCLSPEGGRHESDSIKSNFTNSKCFDKNGPIKPARIYKTCPDQSTSKIRQCNENMTCDPLQDETKNVNDNIKNNNHKHNDLQSWEFGTFRSRYGGHGLGKSIDWSKIREQVSLSSAESLDLVTTKSESTTNTDSSCNVESTADKFERPLKTRTLIDNINERDVGQLTFDSLLEEKQKKNQVFVDTCYLNSVQKSMNRLGATQGCDIFLSAYDNCEKRPGSVTRLLNQRRKPLKPFEVERVNRSFIPVNNNTSKSQVVEDISNSNIDESDTLPARIPVAESETENIDNNASPCVQNSSQKFSTLLRIIKNQPVESKTNSESERVKAFDASSSDTSSVDSLIANSSTSSMNSAMSCSSETEISSSTEAKMSDRRLNPSDLDTSIKIADANDRINDSTMNTESADSIHQSLLTSELMDEESRDTNEPSIVNAVNDSTEVNHRDVLSQNVSRAEHDLVKTFNEGKSASFIHRFMQNVKMQMKNVLVQHESSEKSELDSDDLMDSCCNSSVTKFLTHVRTADEDISENMETENLEITDNSANSNMESSITGDKIDDHFIFDGPEKEHSAVPENLENDKNHSTVTKYTTSPPIFQNGSDISDVDEWDVVGDWENIMCHKSSPNEILCKQADDCEIVDKIDGNVAISNVSTIDEMPESDGSQSMSRAATIVETDLEQITDNTRVENTAFCESARNSLPDLNVAYSAVTTDTVISNAIDSNDMSASSAINKTKSLQNMLLQCKSRNK